MKASTRQMALGLMLVATPLFTAAAQYLMGESSGRAALAAALVNCPTAFIAWLQRSPRKGGAE